MKSSMSKDLNELEALYEETLNERFEDLDNKAGSKEPFSKKSGPIVDGHDGVPVEDPEDADEDNAYEPKKFSQKRRKVVKDNINNFNMSKNADNIFDKLFSSVMEGNYVYEDEPLDDDLGGEEVDVLDSEVEDLGGDEITVTLTTDQVDALKAILDQVSDEGDDEDLGDDEEFGDELDFDTDAPLQEAPVHAEPKAAPSGDELKGKNNKVKGKLSSAKGGSANTGTVKTNDALQAAPDGVAALTGKGNKVGHAKHIGD
jgi:hypothetical protein